MFDFQRQIRLKQAQNAFRDGRIDEAFVIAVEKEIRELRGGQVLLENLVNPFLDRAADHFSGGRLKEASLDVERAIQAGGTRPRAAELRQQIRDATDLKGRDERIERERIESARAHLRNGSLRTGLEVLERAPPGSGEPERLRREAEARERKGEEARARVVAHLEQNDLLESLKAAVEASTAAPRHADLLGLRARLKKAAVTEIVRCLDAGSLEIAAEILSQLVGAAGDSIETAQLGGTLSLATEARSAFHAGSFEAARIALVRLAKELPRAEWVGESARSLEKITDAMQSLRTGPLGKNAAGNAERSPQGATAMSTLKAQGSAPEKAAAVEVGPQSDRLLLWVDGVGTYLVLSQSRVSIGRAGSSAHPDIAIAADISGYHAEVTRSEEDYFIVAAQGQVDVGRQRIARKLLENGDTITLGASCTLTFELPTVLSPTAVLTLHKGQRIEGDVRKILLLKDHLLIGSSSSCHVQAPRKGSTVVLSTSPAGLVCKAEEEILIDGQSAGTEALVPSGAHVQIGELTFTITGSVRKQLG